MKTGENEVLAGPGDAYGGLLCFKTEADAPGTFTLPYEVGVGADVVNVRVVAVDVYGQVSDVDEEAVPVPTVAFGCASLDAASGPRPLVAIGLLAGMLVVLGRRRRLRTP